MDSNHRPHAYQACALTTWATSPYHNNMLCLSHTDYNFGRSGRTWTHDIRFWRPTFYHWTTLLWYVMTEKEGFEPSHPCQIYSLSRGASSATWVLLQYGDIPLTFSEFPNRKRCVPLPINGEGGIRTHAGLHPNGFQDRLVMTASIPLHYGDPSAIRTPDTLIKSQVLCLLS